MKYDENEVNEYVLGSDLWAGMADPILKMGVNDSVFWDLLNQKCPGFGKHLDCEQNRNTAVVLYIQKYPGSPIICSEMNTLIRKLINLVYPGFVDPNAKPAEPVDTRPRDRTGRLMSPKAIKWQQWEQWANDPGTSSKQIEALKNSSPEFREFYVSSLRKEINSTPIDGAVENLNAPRTLKGKIPAGVDEEELRLWCHHYRTLAIDEVRRIMSPGMSGQVVADHNRKLFEAGLAAGLIA
jgi:hypothetical protein